MRYSSITCMDFNNGYGARVSIFLQGCHIHCKGCFNKSAWNFNGGKELTDNIVDLLIKLINKPYCDGLTILGGEPLDQDIYELNGFLNKIKDECPNRTIWLYTGHTFEDILKSTKCLVLPKIDVLVDGPFMEDKKNNAPSFRGSSNQRIIDVKKTLKNDSLSLLEFNK